MRAASRRYHQVCRPLGLPGGRQFYFRPQRECTFDPTIRVDAERSPAEWRAESKAAAGCVGPDRRLQVPEPLAQARHQLLGRGGIQTHPAELTGHPLTLAAEPLQPILRGEFSASAARPYHGFQVTAPTNSTDDVVGRAEGRRSRCRSLDRL